MVIGEKCANICILCIPLIFISNIYKQENWKYAFLLNVQVYLQMSPNCYCSLYGPTALVLSLQILGGFVGGYKIHLLNHAGHAAFE